MILGVDLASVDNNKVDWSVARCKAGISFAILRANYGTAVDPFFIDQFQRVYDAGIVPGAYLFLRFPSLRQKRIATPEQQAEAFLTTLRRVGYTASHGEVLPPTIDIEFPGTGARETGMTAGDLMNSVGRAIELVRREVIIQPMLYTSARVM